MVILPKSVGAWCLFIERNANFMTWQLFINYPDVLAFRLKTSVDVDNISEVCRHHYPHHSRHPTYLHHHNYYYGHLNTIEIIAITIQKFKIQFKILHCPLQS